jgi:hypothetical protein
MRHGSPSDLDGAPRVASPAGAAASLADGLNRAVGVI